MAGVYIHIPFCKSKCPYCDFYSMRCDSETIEAYTDAVVDEISTLNRCGKFLPQHPLNFDTLYLGGGTPSVLHGKQLAKIVESAKKELNISDNAETTIECNPGSDIEHLIPYFKSCGVNRISLGMQSAVDNERKLLGRSASRQRILQVIDLLKSNGITNISLDIMLGIPEQTEETLAETLDFIKKCDVPHISAYILKIEEGTFFASHKERYNLPDDDKACDFYLQCCDFFKENWYKHYEISNFARIGCESHHNTKYWLLEDYLGIGAAAHSFIDKKRFYFENDIKSFIDGKPPVFDGQGGDGDEYVMLRLRLKEGLNMSELSQLYSVDYEKKILKKAPFLKEQGFINFDGKNLSLTEKGFLVSNSIINEFL